MYVQETICFDESDRRAMEAAWTFFPLLRELNLELDQEEKAAFLREEQTNLNRLRDGNNLRRGHLDQGVTTLERLLGEMTRRITVFQGSAKTGLAMSTVSNGPNDVALIDDTRWTDVANGLAQNLEKGIRDVTHMITILTAGRDAIADAPEDIDEDSDEFLEQETDAIVVRRGESSIVVNGDRNVIETLQTLAKRFVGLMDDPHPGLMTWKASVATNITKMAKAIGYNLKPGA